MANTNSTTITNIEANPPVRNDNRNSSGRLRIKSETISIPGSAALGDTFRFFRVKSSDSIKSMRIFHDDLGISRQLTVGLFATNGGAGVSASSYASAYDASSAAVTNGAEIRFSVLNITTVNDKVWQNAGLSSDPVTEYDLVVGIGAAGTGSTGDVTLIVEYTSGD